MIDDGELLEWAPVVGHRSGTPAALRGAAPRARAATSSSRSTSRGPSRYGALVPDAVLIFLEPPSMRGARAAAPRPRDRVRGADRRAARDRRLGDGPARLVRPRGRERRPGTSIVAGRCYHRGIQESAPRTIRTTPTEDPSYDDRTQDRRPARRRRLQVLAGDPGGQARPRDQHLLQPARRGPRRVRAAARREPASPTSRSSIALEEIAEGKIEYERTEDPAEVE